MLNYKVCVCVLYSAVTYARKGGLLHQRAAEAQRETERQLTHTFAASSVSQRS